MLSGIEAKTYVVSRLELEKTNMIIEGPAIALSLVSYLLEY